MMNIGNHFCHTVRMMPDSLLSVHIIGSAGASVGQADGDTARRRGAG